jgi:hypothetical protein
VPIMGVARLMSSLWNGGVSAGIQWGSHDCSGV